MNARASIQLNFYVKSRSYWPAFPSLRLTSSRTASCWQPAALCRLAKPKSVLSLWTYLNLHAVHRPLCNEPYAAMSALCRLVHRGLWGARPSCPFFPGLQVVCGVAPVRTNGSSRYRLQLAFRLFDVVLPRVPLPLNGHGGPVLLRRSRSGFSDLAVSISVYFPVYNSGRIESKEMPFRRLFSVWSEPELTSQLQTRSDLLLFLPVKWGKKRCPLLNERQIVSQPMLTHPHSKRIL